MLHRRELLRVAAALAAGCALPRTAEARRPARPAFERLVVIKLFGGIDAVLTLDPKAPGEVDPDIDLPYREAEIAHAGGLRLGPHFAFLAPLAPRLTVLRGVGTRSVQHPYAQRILNSFKANVAFRAGLLRRPTFVQLAAQLAGHRSFLDGDAMRPDLYELIGSRERQAATLEILEREARARAATASGEPLADARDLVRRIAAAPLARLGPPDARFRRAFECAAWALEHGVARYVGIDVRDDDPYPWDSHSRNLAQQEDTSRALAPLLLGFLDHLARTGLLASTLVVAMSELGRYPVLNDSRGKDHFPEVPVLLAGAGVVGGGRAFGGTDRRMAARPVSLATGAPAATGHRLTIDDLGATILRAIGVADPSVYGYVGAPLDFLRA